MEVGWSDRRAGDSMAAGKHLRGWYHGVLALWSLLLPVSRGHFHGFFRELQCWRSPITHALNQTNISSLCLETYSYQSHKMLASQAFFLNESNTATLTTLSCV